MKSNALPSNEHVPRATSIACLRLRALADGSIPVSQTSGRDAVGPRLSQVGGLSISTGGGVLLSGSEDGSVKIWDLKEKACLWLNRGHAGPIQCMDASHYPLFATSARGEDLVPRVWNVAAFNEGAADRALFKFEGHSAPVTCLSMTHVRVPSIPCNRVLATHTPGRRLFTSRTRTIVLELLLLCWGEGLGWTLTHAARHRTVESSLQAPRTRPFICGTASGAGS